MFDGKAFGDEIVSAVKSYVDKTNEKIVTQLVDVATRLSAMEMKFSTIPVVAREAMQPEIDLLKSTTVLLKELHEIEMPVLPDIPKLIEEAIQNYDSINLSDVRKFVEEERTKADSKIVNITSLVDTLSVDIKAYQKNLDEAIEATNLNIKEVTASVPKEDAVIKKVLGSVDLMAMVSEEVNKAIAIVPVAKDGKDGIDGINGKDGKDGIDGISVDFTQVTDLILRSISDEVAIAIKAIPTPKDGIDGKSITIEDVKPFITEEIKQATNVLQKAVEAIPQGADGERGEAGQDGKSITLEDVKPFITELVAAIPIPKDGKDGKDGNDGTSPDIDEIVSKAVSFIPHPANGANGKDGINGKDGKDGIGVAGIMIDRNGDCIFTLSNGEMKNIGTIHGKDGSPGLNGKDGNNGLDGKDGIGWDSMEAEYRDDGLYLVWTKGDVIKEALVPGIKYKDIWLEEKKDYKMGDLVTWAGSLWIAKVDNALGPPKSQGEGGRDWKLAVKKGRDGRDGRNGKDFTKPVKLEEDK